jgi:O-antigen/teichoic acid export membrane protein
MFMTGLGIMALMLICAGGPFAAQTRWVILLNGIGIAIDGFSQLIYGLLALNSRMDRIAISMGAKGLLSLGGVAAGLAWTHSIIWAAAGSALASALIVLGYDVASGVQILYPVPKAGYAWKTSSMKAALLTFGNRDAMRRLTALAAPMGITVTLITLTTSIPRLFLERQFGASNLGLFAAQASFVTIGRMASSSLDQASRPQLARHYGDGDRAAFVRLLNRLLLLGLALSGVILVGAEGFGRAVLRLFFTPEYARNLDVLIISMGASGLGFLGNTYLNAMSAARRFRVQAWCMMAVVCVVALASATLIPVLGLRGAALASLAAMAVQVVAGALIVRNIVSMLPLACKPHDTPIETERV